MEPLTLLTAGVIALGAVVSYAQYRKVKTRAQTVAASLGLGVQGQDALVGRYRGVALVMASRGDGGAQGTGRTSTTDCELLDPLPAGMEVRAETLVDRLAGWVGFADLQLGTALDPKLRIRGTHPEEVRELLLDPGVHGALEAILDAGGTVELSGSSLRVVSHGYHLHGTRERADRAVGLVLALAEAGRGPWRALAERHHLSADPGWTAMRGAVDGIPIQVGWDPAEDGRTEIVAPVIPGLPRGTTIRHADLEPDGIALGDPILDGMVGVRTDDPQAVVARLCRDAVRGPLLEVVHGHPGSSVDPAWIRLVAPGRLRARLPGAVELVVELARALGTEDRGG